MNALRTLAIALLASVAVAGCTASRPATAPRFGDAVTSDSVLTLLEGRGLTVVNYYEATPSPELQTIADLEVAEFAALRGRLHVYVFRSVESAKRNAVIRDFGSVCRQRAAAPSIRTRFNATTICDKVPVFQQGALVVTYVGEETVLEPVLRDAFGPPVQS